MTEFKNTTSGISSSEKKTTEKLSMQTIRTEINRVDAALLDLIAERMELAQAVRRAKSGVDVWRPSREESHVRDLVKKSGEISPELVSRIWAELTSASLTLQGPIRLHISLAVDALTARALVRDRFGGAIPTNTYPTESAALAAAQADPEGVAVLPAPGGMNNWWTALGPQGAASDMHILAGLPRTEGQVWPNAVAVSKAEKLPSGDDQSLLYIEAGDIGALTSLQTILENEGFTPTLRAELETLSLYSVPEFVDSSDPRITALQSKLKTVAVVGILPSPIPKKRNKA
ncbi:MAG: hypothetical protein COA43_02525 [Robiginitomaculum sp.]|nr:MAG: hypothetical protein COA43_02525 [Robiginitomaculum sp.]